MATKNAKPAATRSTVQREQAKDAAKDQAAKDRSDTGTRTTRDDVLSGGAAEAKAPGTTTRDKRAEYEANSGPKVRDGAEEARGPAAGSANPRAGESPSSNRTAEEITKGTRVPGSDRVAETEAAMADPKGAARADANEVADRFGAAGVTTGYAPPDLPTDDGGPGSPAFGTGMVASGGMGIGSGQFAQTTPDGEVRSRGSGDYKDTPLGRLTEALGLTKIAGPVGEQAKQLEQTGDGLSGAPPAGGSGAAPDTGTGAAPATAPDDKPYAAKNPDGTVTVVKGDKTFKLDPATNEVTEKNLTTGESTTTNPSASQPDPDSVDWEPPPGWIDSEALLPPELRADAMLQNATGKRPSGGEEVNPVREGGSDGSLGGEGIAGDAVTLVGQPPPDEVTGGSGRVSPEAPPLGPDQDAIDPGEDGELPPGDMLTEDPGDVDFGGSQTLDLEEMTGGSSSGTETQFGTGAVMTAGRRSAAAALRTRNEPAAEDATSSEDTSSSTVMAAEDEPASDAGDDSSTGDDVDVPAPEDDV